MLESDELLIEKVSPYTLLNSERLKSLIRICQYLNSQGISGDFVECGAAKGGSAAIISKYLDCNRHLWLYDSFEGMPETTEKDGEDAREWIGKCVGSIEDVRNVMTVVETSEECYSIKKGWFSETFCEPLPEKVALLHCDADWYDSVTLVLETFYNLIPTGGCVVLDDFGYWEGCREAFYDFCFRHSEKPLLERVGQDQAYWIKGKNSNRTIVIDFYPAEIGRMSNQQTLEALDPLQPQVLATQTQLERSQSIMESAKDFKPSSLGTELEYTGERHMTEQVGLALSLSHIDHMVRYAFASSFVSGKRVLDITCGSGYGTQYMALQGATKVVGIDIDEKAIDYALKFHNHEAIQYSQSDAHYVSQLEDASFDVIVSYETIEHLQKPKDFLLELRRLLKPEGKLFISCPNDYRVSPWISEFHLHRFKFNEFRDLVVNVFGEATFLGQHNTMTSSLFKPLCVQAKTSQFEAYKKPLSLNFFEGQYLDYISPIESSNGYLAVIGVDPSLIGNQTSISQNAFQEVMESFYFATEEMKRARQEVSSLRGELAQLRQQNQTEIERWQSQLQQIQLNYQMQIEHWQSQSQQTEVDYQTEIKRWQSQLQQTESAYQAEVERSQSQLQQTQRELERSQSQLQQTQREVERSQSQLQQTQRELERSQSQLQQTQRELERSESIINAMESSKFWQLRLQWLRLKKLVGL